MKDREPVDLLREYYALKTDKYNVEGTFDVIEKFVVPYRGIFFNEKTSEGSVDWRKREIYDATACVAAQNLAASIHSGLTNEAFKWFDFGIRDKELQKASGVKEWMEKVSDIVFYHIQESNFNVETNEKYLDLVSFGTGFMTEEVVETKDKEFKELDFSAAPIDNAYFMVDYKGQVLAFYRRFEWTAIQIKDKFGEENVPESILERCKANNVTEKQDVIFCIYKRYPGETDKESDTYKTLHPDRRPVGYQYILEDGKVRLGDIGGYYEMPVFATRYRKTSGSVWGHSPAMVVLANILTLNEMEEMILTAAEKVLDPAFATTRRGVIGDLDLRAGGLTVVESANSIWPLLQNTATRFDAAGFNKEDLQNSIRQIYFMDQLQLKESPAMTATEVQARFQLMQRLTGPTLGRVRSDYLDPMLKRTFMILFRYGMFPELPDALADKELQLELTYHGPMANAQKQERIMATQAWLGDIAAMTQIFPKARLVVKEEEVARLLGEDRGVPARAINDQNAVKAAETEEKAAQMKQQQIMEAQAGGDAAKAVGEGATAMKEAGVDAEQLEA